MTVEELYYRLKVIGELLDYNKQFRGQPESVRYRQLQNYISNQAVYLHKMKERKKEEKV